MTTVLIVFVALYVAYRVGYAAGKRAQPQRLIVERGVFLLNPNSLRNGA
jgi:hypothetical protein